MLGVLVRDNELVRLTQMTCIRMAVRICLDALPAYTSMSAIMRVQGTNAHPGEVRAGKAEREAHLGNPRRTL